MGASFSHQCDNCGYTVNTSGPWEFYRDKNGVKKPYGHPVPTSKEAEDNGIKGLYGTFYCSKCDKTFESIIVEYKKSTKHSLDVWGGMAEPLDEYKNLILKCPDCGNIDLLTDASNEKLINCPKCKKGKFIGMMEWIA